MRRILALIYIMMLLGACTGQNSQVELPETYDSGLLRFNYPSGWDVHTTGQPNSLDIGRFNPTSDTVQLEVSSPVGIAQYAIMGLSTNVHDLVLTRIQLSQQFGTIIISAITEETPVSSPEAVNVIDFTVNNLPAAYTLSTTHLDAETNSVMVVVLQVSDDYVVTLTASFPPNNGPTTIEQYRDTVLAVVNTIHYTPFQNPLSSNPNLPRVFSEQVGSLATGLLTFFYPDGWYVAQANVIVLQNYLGQQSAASVSGHIGLTIAAPDVSLYFLFGQENIRQCNYDVTTISPASVLHSYLTPERLTSVDDIESRTLAGKNAASSYFTQDTQDGLAIAVETSLGNVVLMSGFAPSGELQQYEETLFAIAETFDYTPILSCAPGT